MKTDHWSEVLPGGKLMKAGLADFQAGRCTVGACLVAIASQRLVAKGLLPNLSSYSIPEPERQLYRLLLSETGDAYSRYNSLIRELVSFEQALERMDMTSGPRD